jgi:hypothetical protein
MPGNAPGGIGVSYSITGTSQYYGAGGSGGYPNGAPNGGLTPTSYGTGGRGTPTIAGTPGAVIIRYPV